MNSGYYTSSGWKYYVKSSNLFLRSVVTRAVMLQRWSVWQHRINNWVIGVKVCTVALWFLVWSVLSTPHTSSEITCVAGGQGFPQSFLPVSLWALLYISCLIWHSLGTGLIFLVWCLWITYNNSSVIYSPVYHFNPNSLSSMRQKEKKAFRF